MKELIQLWVMFFVTFCILLAMVFNMTKEDNKMQDKINALETVVTQLATDQYHKDCSKPECAYPGLYTRH
jgi:competence protein ComGC